MRSQRFQMLAVTFILAATVVSTLNAQEPGQGRGRGQGGQGGQGGRGGFQPGGFGGGFGGGIGGRGGGLAGLLQDPKVRTEIELLDDQTQELAKVAEAARANRGGLGGAGGERPNFQNMSDEERQKFIADMRERAEKAEKEMNAKLADILLPHQMERLQQLSIQRRGVGALMDPEVAAKLKITDDQKKQMATVQEEMSNKMRESARELFQGGGGNREEAMKKLGEMRTEIEKKVLGVLTEGQQKSFEELKGKAFEFSPPQVGGFGGPGGAGGPGGPGGNRPQRPNIQ